MISQYNTKDSCRYRHLVLVRQILGVARTKVAVHEIYYLFLHNTCCLEVLQIIYLLSTVVCKIENNKLGLQESTSFIILKIQISTKLILYSLHMQNTDFHSNNHESQEKYNQSSTKQNNGEYSLQQR